MESKGKIVAIISAKTEWRLVKGALKPDKIETTPFGEYFEQIIDGKAVTFCQGGVGKIDAAASAQYVITRWRPVLLINLGTCGGIRGQVEKGDIFLIERTIVYDLFDQMGYAAEMIKRFETDINLSWVGGPLPAGVKRGTMLSGDRDLLPQDVERLRRDYDAKIADWESGSIARVCRLNDVPCLILRGVSDLVDSSGGEAYMNPQAFKDGAAVVMPKILATLPFWIDASKKL